MRNRQRAINRRDLCKRIVLAILILGVLGTALIFGVDFYMKQAVKNRIVSVNDASGMEEMDCILVLGAQVKADGTPSLMLKGRLDKAIELYKAGTAPKLLMSGDHGRDEYDEVNEMKSYAMAAGVPSKDIFMDHAGFSTYESMYRAKEIFQVEKMVVVTQDYHLYRSLYNAEAFDMDAYGVAVKEKRYGGQLYRDLREVAARDKDFVYTLLKVKPTYLGEAIPVSGNGDVTNDKVK